MPLETVVAAFVVIALVAIGWRFLPRSAEGSVRLPTVVDESVGMWLFRRALGRATEPPEWTDDDAIPEPSPDEIAYRIGVPGAPPPTLPTRIVVSRAPSRQDSPAALAEPAAPAAIGPVVRDRSVGRHRTARPSGALAAQRRSAGAVALAVVAIAVTTLALGTRQLGGDVLSVTGTPGGSMENGFVSGDSGSPAAPSADSTDQSPSSPPSPTDEASATTATTPAPTVTVTPTARPTPIPTRTPKPTIRPTATPTLTVTPLPSPSAGPSVALTPSPQSLPTPSTLPEPSAPASPIAGSITPLIPAPGVRRGP